LCLYANPAYQHWEPSTTPDVLPLLGLLISTISEPNKPQLHAWWDGWFTGFFSLKHCIAGSATFTSDINPRPVMQMPSLPNGLADATNPPMTTVKNKFVFSMRHQFRQFTY